MLPVPWSSVAALSALVLLQLAEPSLHSLWAGGRRSAWLSVAGGIAVAFACFHDFPAIASGISPASPRFALSQGLVLLAAFLGFAIFFALDRTTRRGPDPNAAPGGGAGRPAYLGHLVALAAVGVAIGFLLVQHERGTRERLFFSVATGSVILVAGYAVRERHPREFGGRGRWPLAGALAAGFAAGTVMTVPELAVAAVRAFFVGAVAMIVLGEEMRDDVETNLWAFLASVLVFFVLGLSFPTTG